MSKKSHPGDLYAHFDRHLAEAKQRFPEQFSQPMISCDWPDGWNELVFRVLAHIDSVGAELYWSQIKEKFGGLRMYYTGGPLHLDVQSPTSLTTFTVGEPKTATPDDVDTIIREAQQQSYETCCKCGGPGRQVQIYSWWFTYCETCEPLIQEHRSQRFPGGEFDGDGT